MRFSKNMQNMELSIMKKIEMQAKALPDVVSLAQGIPSFDTPEHIKEAMRNALQGKGIARYGSSKGMQELRAALAEKLARVNGIPAGGEEQVLVTAGCMGALKNAFLATVNQGEEILMPNPSYTPHIELAQLMGARPKFFGLREEKEWALDIEDVGKQITEKTKAIVFSNPSNPTGRAYRKKELRELAGVAAQHGLWLIADETYEYFLYNGEKQYSIASDEEFREKTVSCFSFSKSYAMAGYRVGYMAASEEMIAQALKVQGTFDICPSVIAQQGALAAVQGKQECVEEFRQAFDRRRKKMVQGLREMGEFDFVEPEAAYYVFAKLRNGKSGEQYARELLEQAGVAVVPGKSFGKGLESYVRLCFAMEDKDIDTALERMRVFADKNRK